MKKSKDTTKQNVTEGLQKTVQKTQTTDTKRPDPPPPRKTSEKSEE